MQAADGGWRGESGNIMATMALHMAQPRHQLARWRASAKAAAPDAAA